MEKPPVIPPGPKKIVDCKIDENGKQLYKVKWERTWEPAENLGMWQHLVDEFWSFVDNAKKTELTAKEQSQNDKTLSVPCEVNQVVALQKLSPGEKEGIEELINRTISTSVSTSVAKMVLASTSYQLSGDAPVAPPSFLSPPQTPVKHEPYPTPQQQESPLAYRIPLSPSGNVSSPLTNDPSFGDNTFHSSSKTQLNTAVTPTKQEKSPKVGRQLKMETPGKQPMNADDGVSNAGCLKYIQNFSHPYVKLIIVCKICNKEAAKRTDSWKRHYMTHSNEKAPKNQAEGTPPAQKKKRPSKSENTPVKLEDTSVKQEMF